MSAQVDSIQLLKELHELKLRPDEDIRSVVSRVESVVNNLASVGKVIDDDTKLTHIINILSQNPSYKVTLDHMLATATSDITLKSLVRGFNVMHVRASMIPGALKADGNDAPRNPDGDVLEKYAAKFEEGMANLAKRFDGIAKHYSKNGVGRGNGGRGGRGGRQGGRGGNNNGGRGGRGRSDSGRGYHPYGSKEKFDGNCDNCGRYGHKARNCFRPCRICNDPAHNVTKCPRNSRAPFNRDNNREKAPSRDIRSNLRHTPRANMAQADSNPDNLYHAFHGEEFDVEPSAHMAIGSDVDAPPGFGGPSSSGASGPSIPRTAYGKALKANTVVSQSHTWILDGGATHHMTPLRFILFDYVEDVSPVFVKVANNKWAKRAGVGSIRVHTNINGVPMRKVIRDVWHMPTFDNSLLSPNQLKAKGHWTISGRNGDMNEYIFDENDKLWLACKVQNGLNVPMWSYEAYVTPTYAKVTRQPPPTQVSLPNILPKFETPVHNAPPPQASFASSNVSTDVETPHLWHQRLAHVPISNLQFLLRHNAISGITLPVTEFAKCSTHPCEVCIMAKHRRAPHLKELPKPVEPMHVCSSDICGPYKVRTQNMCAYVLTFVDWCTQHVHVALMQKKSEAFKELKRLITMYENLHGKKLKYLFTDRGGEYISDGLKDWFAEKGVVHDFSVAHTPQQNGVAERMNQTLNNMVRSMMLQYKSHPSLWGEAMMYAVRIKNFTLNKRLGMTPHEALTGKVPNVANFRTFGCMVYARVAEDDRSKLDPKSIPGIYLGPELNGPGYRVLVYKPEYKRAHKYAVQVFRDIVCFENLHVVTGARTISDLHWGGPIALPTPVETAHESEKGDVEHQVSHHGAKELALPSPNLYARLKGMTPRMEQPVEHPPRDNDNVAHVVTRSHALLRETPENPGGHSMYGELDIGGSRGNLELALFHPSHGMRNTSQLLGPTLPAQPDTAMSVGDEIGRNLVGPPPNSGGDTLVSRIVGPQPSFAPPLVPQRPKIVRFGAANTSVGQKRSRHTLANVDPKDLSDFQRFFANLGFDPVVATAYTAHAPFHPPPSDCIPTKEDLVEGLLNDFNVPMDRRGPVPVLTEVDPTNPPKTLKQAMESKYARQWAEATVDEWMSVIANNTWELVDSKPWMKIIPCKWVYVVKVDERGLPTRFKARLVAGGHRQVEGIDYDETYAPVSRMTTLRILLTVAACHSLIVHQVDIKTAFLHDKADLDIYMRQPPGFIDGQNLVCKLRKTLYGLKQALRAWYFVLKGVLNDLGFEQISADSSFWVHRTKDVVVFLTSVVDDMLIVSPDEAYTLSIVRAILDKLPGTHNGRASYYNGLRITWLDDTKEVLLTQAAHVEKTYERFVQFMGDTKQRSLPAKEGLRICRSGSNFTLTSHELDVSRYTYRDLIGCISYITHGTRPDATHITNQLAKVSNLPMWEHWCIALDLLSFLYHSRFWGLKFGGYDLSPKVTFASRAIHLPRRRDPPVVGYADANHGTGIDDKRSISGFVIKVLGGPVSWASRTQSLTAASSTESEFRALSECSREALWVAKLLEAFGIPSSPFLICGDSQGALGAIKNYQYTKHTKHIEIVHDFMKDRYQSGQLDFEYVRGDSNPADIFTKCLGKHKFCEFRDLLGMAELPLNLR